MVDAPTPSFVKSGSIPDDNSHPADIRVRNDLIKKHENKIDPIFFDCNQ